jgi:hypothetical protein
MLYVGALFADLWIQFKELGQTNDTPASRNPSIVERIFWCLPVAAYALYGISQVARGRIPSLMARPPGLLSDG